MSLKRVIAGERPQVRDALFLAYRNYQRSVCDKRWKLIRFPQINQTLLFDLRNDPRETDNLACNPSHRKLTKRMMGLLAREQKRYGDNLSLTTRAPSPAAFDPPKERLKTPHPAGGLAPEANRAEDKTRATR